MKRRVIACIALAIACLALGGCLSVRPFSAVQLERISGFPWAEE